jgi:hypothetical protein
VYGGDFFAVPRSEWDPERLLEQPGDVQRTLQLFEESSPAVRGTLLIGGALLGKNRRQPFREVRRAAQ